MSEIARRTRTERQIWAAPGSTHDRVVAISRILLPTAIGVLAAFLVMAPVYNRGEVSFVLDKNKVELAHERLKIQAATYRGEDGKGQPFQLTAASAVQKSSAEPIVRLNQLAAQIALPDGPATLTAPTGRYDMSKEQVMVDGQIKLRANDGYALDTQSATVDLKTRKLLSTSPVTGTVPQGTFSADTMSADLETHNVSLSGNARLRIVPRHAR
jgi:lipopolysaccharide export system protein LptC